MLIVSETEPLLTHLTQLIVFQLTRRKEGNKKMFTNKQRKGAYQHSGKIWFIHLAVLFFFLYVLPSRFQLLHLFSITIKRCSFWMRETTIILCWDYPFGQTLKVKLCSNVMLRLFVINDSQLQTHEILGQYWKSYSHFVSTKVKLSNRGLLHSVSNQSRCWGISFSDKSTKFWVNIC